MEPGALVGGALRLEPAAFEAIVRAEDGLRVALAVLLGAGLSNAIGQSVALFASRVRPWRFVASLAVGALLFAASVLIWGGAVALLSATAFGQPVEPYRIVRVVGLAHAPRLFAFLVLVPYFGGAIGAALTAWTLLALVAAVRTVYAFDVVQLAVVLGLAWLAIELLSRTVGRPVVGVARGLRRLAAGRPLRTLPLRAARVEPREEER